MADGYRFTQHAAGNYYYNTQATHPSQRHQILRNGTPPNNIRAAFNTDTPSPSRSPVAHSPYAGMYNQGHQQGQHGRVNGGPAVRGMNNMMHNYQQQYQNTHPQQAQHQVGVQQDHTAHPSNGTVLSHHPNYSGVMPNATPFTPSGLQNGQLGTTRGGLPQVVTEHWAKQLEMHKESENANADMAAGSVSYYARKKALENKGLTPAQPPTEATDEEGEENKDLGRMLDSRMAARQDWCNLDMSGQSLRNLSPAVFNYNFLKELYIASNKLSELPSAIGELRHLQHLDASHNQIVELPKQLAMCVELTKLLVFNNNIRTLPGELGALYKLEMLGIEGNPLDTDLKQLLMEEGTEALITHLRETRPGKRFLSHHPHPKLIHSSPDASKRAAVAYFWR